VSTPASGYRAGARAVLPLTIAVLAFGLSYGVLARAAGMGPIAPVVMSATTFAGSAQFAVASVLEASGGVTAAVAAGLLLNARYAPMSIVAAPGFQETGLRWSWLRRLLASQLIVDESWALAARRGGRFDLAFMLGAGLVLYPTWVLSTVVGVVAGDLVGDPGRLGLNAAFPALFLALLVPMLRSRTAVAAALLGAAIALALIPVAAPGVPIIAASAACLVGLRR
jgi:4-azaleucine resistance transporter AzlC